MKYINHSGGCPGSDMTWENEGYNYGIETIAYSFPNHSQKSRNPKILSVKELEEGFQHAEIANKTLKRNLYSLRSTYVRNLISRNWFQVKNSDAIYAIGTFVNDQHTLVNGGTGWAVQMAIDSLKPVFLFEQNVGNWFTYVHGYTQNAFTQLSKIPTLTSNFAGIGTREINQAGTEAIKEILKANINV